jgi:Arc/MetJ-type ribon-helix-helix transcriptional regulator
MSYQFPPDLEERVKARMSDGRYGSEDDLLRQAMDALDQLEQDKITRWDERNQIALEQSRHGLSKPLDCRRTRHPSFPGGLRRLGSTSTLGF